VIQKVRTRAAARIQRSKKVLVHKGQCFFEYASPNSNWFSLTVY
jgi:hypothetical protein